ncbi:hypothetical protein F0P96_18500 [Hymenobacter busanensis]|uniref:Uncharacterized protein n=1 Tax=Hymenobacter busanensis TaxID=2607656 RepID=A0A7L4ZWU0_9BACT|nr:hypothetical protein [Hymenobacter busanensis]KAA9327224.1 hypothetical protein F0P96_18500 [Hymenobacter busanensis]QHJ05890.1 hypothetical protein GUY19_00705 [Hymenobacter busanensis]
MENFLLDGEELIRHTPNNVVVLTTHRLRYSAANSSHSRLVSMMLDKVSSCEVRYESQPGLWVIGSLFAILGGMALFAGGTIQLFGVLAIVLGLVLIVAYLSTRRHIVSITSDGGTRIGFETKGLKREAVIAFVNEIEKAKTERVERLYQLANSVLA